MKNWSEVAGNLLGKIVGIYFAIAFAVMFLVLPTKAVFMFCQFVWNLF